MYIYIYIYTQIYIYIHVYIYIYIYIAWQAMRLPARPTPCRATRPRVGTANPPTNIVGFGGLDSSIILI